jgi:RNA polymerase sigma-70 factor (ECF subfamily)
LPPLLSERKFDVRPQRFANLDGRCLREGVTMSDRVAASAEVDGLAELVLSHLDSAYNLARWLVRSSVDAEDVVQEAYLRAFQYSAGFRGGDARAWLLTIVRNTSYRWLRKMRAYDPTVPFDEEMPIAAHGTLNPEELVLQNADGRLVHKALHELPVRFREILVLRELEGLSYKEIADVMRVPVGTVMSTLSRARGRLRKSIGGLLEHEQAAGSVDAGHITT